MPKVKFGDVVKEVKNKIDRNNNPYEYYVAGDHMDSEDLTIHRRGCFATDDVGPAFIREFRKGQVLYGSRRTYLKKVAVADFDGVTANTTFVLETKDQNVLLQELLPFIMLTDNFTKWSIGKSKGSTNPYILFSDLADYEFDLPTIEEQRKLATVLWKMFRLKEGYVELQHQSDQLVQSQFIEMFYNGAYPVEKIGNVVDKAVKRMGKVFNENDDILYLDISSIDRDSKSVIGLTPYKVKNAPSRAQYVLNKGDILYSTVRPNLENIAVNPYSDNNIIGSTGFCILRCSKVLSGFMWGVITSDKFTNKMVSAASGANYPAVTDKMVYEYEFPLPSIEEQLKFENILRQTDKSKFVLQETLKYDKISYFSMIKSA